jgi:hypothetical protein
MAITARLPKGLKAEAENYAHSVGISLNALLAVALRDYLDARQPSAGPILPAAVTPMGRPATVGPAATADVSAPDLVHVIPNRSEPTEAELYALRMRPPLGARGLCGCGSGKRWNQCHGLVLMPR